MIELLGKRISTVRKSADATALAFDTDAGPVAYAAFGDCCSESWFNHVVGLDCLIGGSVRDVEVLPEAEAEATRQERDIVYGWRIHTDKGTASVEMRNSSNGYYGGSADPDESASEQATVEVREDF